MCRSKLFTNFNPVKTSYGIMLYLMQVCGICVTDKVVDIIFHVFDANRDGNLSASEFVRVIQRREHKSSGVGFGSLISCCMNCVSNLSSSKLQL